MRIRHELLCVVWLVGAGLAACVDPHDPAKEETAVDDGPGSESAAANEAQAAALAKARGPGESELPTGVPEMPLPEDFEDEVSGQITDENYESELDALERELGQE